MPASRSRARGCFRKGLCGLGAAILLFGSSAVAHADPAPPAAAEKSEIDLFQLDTEVQKKAVSIASKRDEVVDDAPGSVTVITREQIRDMNAMSLADVLNTLVPGMDVVPTYFRYGDHNTGVYSRGLLSDFSQQVLFLLNGQTKFNESTYASPYMAIQWNLENIERIEVSRTPVPLQGGGAITVINLVTREQQLRNGGQAFLNLSTNQDDFTSSVLQGLRATVILGHDIGPLRVAGSAQYYTDTCRQPRCFIRTRADLGSVAACARARTAGAADAVLSALHRQDRVRAGSQQHDLHRAQ